MSFFANKMRLLLLLIFITIAAAKKSRHKKVTNEEDQLTDRLIAKAELDSKFNKARTQPVPFGHIFKEGFGDPNSPVPLDFLELSSVYVKRDEKIDEQIRSGSRNIQPILKEKPLGFASPKDEFYFGAIERDDQEEKETEKPTNDTMWFDFAGLHNRNLKSPYKKLPGFKDIRPVQEGRGRGGKEQYFSRRSFDLVPSKREKKINMTTCVEFGRRADFHPNDVVNIDWVPFYVWDDGTQFKGVAQIHRFNYPTKKLVKKYKDELGPYLNKTIDWEQPKLVLTEGTVDKSEMLLIAADRRGLFDAIPYTKVPTTLKIKKLNVPHYTVHLKIVDPYLAMMFCELQFATIMATSGNEPTDPQEMASAAATLKFRGNGNPVSRDLESEKMVEHFQRQDKIRKEEEQFIVE